MHFVIFMESVSFTFSSSAAVSADSSQLHGPGLELACSLCHPMGFPCMLQFPSTCHRHTGRLSSYGALSLVSVARKTVRGALTAM